MHSIQIDCEKVRCFIGLSVLGINWVLNSIIVMSNMSEYFDDAVDVLYSFE